MTALDTKALLTGVTPGDWEIFTRPSDGTFTILVRNATGPHKHVAYLCWGKGEGGEPDARLIASAPRLARRVIELEEALAEARPVVEAMTGTEWAGVGKFNCWQKADDSLRAIKAKIEAALKGEGDE